MEDGSASPLPAEGTLVGRYRLGTCRSRERVYASFYATRIDSNSACILRILRASPTEPRILRAELEREALRQLAEAPHVVRLLDWGVHDHRPYLVTDDLCGRSLHRWLSELREQGRPAEVRSACRIMHGAALALQAAHARGVFHCALDPTKVWIDVDGRGRETGRVLGFAVPRLHGPGRIASAAELGTPAYTSLAQAIGTPPKPAFDVFAWGTLLLELLSGTTPPPIAGWGESNRPDLRTLRPDLPSDLVALVEDCITADARFAVPSLDEVLTRLEPVLEQVSRTRETAHPLSGPVIVSRERAGRPLTVTFAVVAALTLGTVVGFGMYKGALPPLISASSETGDTHAAHEPSLSRRSLDDANAIVRNDDAVRWNEADDGPRASPPAIAVSAFPAPPAPPFIPSRHASELPPAPADATSDAPPRDRARTMQPRKPTEAFCRRVRAAAEVARKDRDFAELLAKLRHRSCFDRDEHVHLKVLALLRLHRYKECVAAGQRAKALVVSRRVAICKSRLRD